jgi:c-di-GMP-binding flagellar brake protein YcgR
MIFLLQTQYFNPQQDTTSLIIILCILVFLVILFVFGSRFSSRSRTGKSRGKKKHYGRFVFSRISKQFGLSKTEIKILSHLAKINNVREPYLLFSNAHLLDEVLKNSIYKLNQNYDILPDEKEKKLNTFFQIKQKLDIKLKRGLGIKSTNLIRSGQPLLVIFYDGSKIGSKVLRNFKSYLVCSIPIDVAQNRGKWQRGARVKVLFWRQNDSGYSFMSKIIDFGKVEETPAMYLQHASGLKRNQQRKTKRKSLNRKCFYYPIEVLTFGEGHKAQRKTIIQYNMRRMGTVIDICAGGCSVACTHSMDPGKYLKMEFKINLDEEHTAFGRIRRVTEQNNFITMHIVFTKISSHLRNQIYSHVYNYV